MTMDFVGIKTLTYTPLPRKALSGGYRVGDAVNGASNPSYLAGTVIDRRYASRDERKESKLVTVDTNRNGKADAGEDKLMVRFANKNVIKAQWSKEVKFADVAVGGALGLGIGLIACPPAAIGLLLAAAAATPYAIAIKHDVEAEGLRQHAIPDLIPPKD